MEEGLEQNGEGRIVGRFCSLTGERWDRSMDSRCPFSRMYPVPSSVPGTKRPKGIWKEKEQGAGWLVEGLLKGAAFNRLAEV